MEKNVQWKFLSHCVKKCLYQLIKLKEYLHYFDEHKINSARYVTELLRNVAFETLQRTLLET